MEVVNWGAKVEATFDRHGGRTNRKGGIDWLESNESRNKITRSDRRRKRGGGECTVVYREMGLG